MLLASNALDSGMKCCCATYFTRPQVFDWFDVKGKGSLEYQGAAADLERHKKGRKRCHASPMQDFNAFDVEGDGSLGCEHMAAGLESQELAPFRLQVFDAFDVGGGGVTDVRLVASSVLPVKLLLEDEPVL